MTNGMKQTASGRSNAIPLTFAPPGCPGGFPGTDPPATTAPEAAPGVAAVAACKPSMHMLQGALFHIAVCCSAV